MSRVVVLGLFVLVCPAEVAYGKIATLRTVIVEIRAHDSARGMELGVLTLAWAPDSGKPELRTVKVMKYSKMTALGKGGRAPITLKELKPGMTVASEMSANRLGDMSWKLDALHVLDPDKDPDPAVVKLLSALVTSFIGSVTKVTAPPAGAGQIGRLEVRREGETFLFDVSKDTQIARQTADGKLLSAKFTEVTPGSEVVVMYPGPLVTGVPPRAPATRILIIGSPK